MGKTDELVQAWRALGPVGWAEGPSGWIVEGGKPIALAAWQRAVLLAWWAHRATVSTLAISNVKKTGKTLANAVTLAYRWLSLPGEHYAVGNDLDQAAGRQFREIAAMVQRNPYLRANVKADKRLLTFTPTGSTIAALAVDAGGNAGSNHISVSHTEAWAVVYEAGIRAWEELAPPPLGPYGDEYRPLRIADSYAGFESESLTWHGIVDAGLAGELIDDNWPIYLAGGLLLFHMEGEEARARCFLGTPAQAERYYADQRRQLRQMAFTRQHDNARTSGAEAFITEAEWRAIEDPALSPIEPTRETPVYIGLDLAVRSDYAALVAVVANGRDRARIAFHRIWKPRPGYPVSLADVQAFVRSLAADYWVGGVFFDPSQGLLMAEQLRAAGVPMREVKQTLPELGPRGTLLFESVRDGRLSTYPDDDLRSAAVSAIAKEIPQGLHLVKGQAKGRKIDPLVALSFALPAAIAAGHAAPPGALSYANRSHNSRWVAVRPTGSRWGRGERRGWHR